MAGRNWTLWHFHSPLLESAYAEDRARSWRRLDRAVVVPWTLLWVSIIKRHWHNLPYVAILKSFSFFIVIVSPFYLQLLLGRGRYTRRRLVVVTLAKTAYVFHAGGGLYRDGLMSVANTALGAANLFVRLLIGSRTLFWLVLSFGYQLPPHLQVPLDAAHVGLMMWMKPSTPFCGVMQTPASEPLFRTIANSLPLISLMPLGRPVLRAGADVCNPLIAWMQIGLGYLLPTLAFVCIDVDARRRFALRRAASLSPQDAASWVANKSSALFSVWAIMALVLPHALTALWYALMWHQLELGPAAHLGGSCAAPGAGAAAAAAVR